MPHSLDRFLTTHTGSLPRPDDLIQMMYAKEEGKPVDREALAQRIRSSVGEVVGKQRKAGLDRAFVDFGGLPPNAVEQLPTRKGRDAFARRLQPGSTGTLRLGLVLECAAVLTSKMRERDKAIG